MGEELVINEKLKISGDRLIVSAVRSSGPGGQNVNKLETAVRIKHIPTGISIVSREERTQYANKKAAVKKLEEKLTNMEIYHQKEEEMKIWSVKNEIERGNPDLIFEDQFILIELKFYLLFTFFPKNFIIIVYI